MPLGRVAHQAGEGMIASADTTNTRMGSNFSKSSAIATGTRHGRDDPGLQDDMARRLSRSAKSRLPGLIEWCSSTEFRLIGRPAIARESLSACSRDVRDPPRAAVDLADPVVPGIGDEDLTVFGDGQAVRPLRSAQAAGPSSPPLPSWPVPARVVQARPGQARGRGAGHLDEMEGVRSASIPRRAGDRGLKRRGASPPVPPPATSSAEGLAGWLGGASRLEQQTGNDNNH